MRTWPTSGPMRPRSANRSSTSTTSTRRCPDPGNGTSSDWSPVSSLPARTTASPVRWARMRPSKQPPRTAGRWQTWPTSAPWTSGTTASTWHSSRPSCPQRRTRRDSTRDMAKARSKTSQRALGKLTETVDGKLQIRSDPPLLERLTDLSKQRPEVGTDNLNQTVRGQLHAVRGLRERQPQGVARTIRGRRHRPEGRGRGFGRHPVPDRAAHRSGQRRTPDPADQGGDVLRAGEVPAGERLPPPRSARRGGSPADAGLQRHLPRVVVGGPRDGQEGEEGLLLAAVPRHEGFGERRRHDSRSAQGIRQPLRRDVGTRPRPRRATPWPSPPISATATPSTARSATSPWPTPSRTTRTTRPSPRRSAGRIEAADPGRVVARRTRSGHEPI